MAKRTCSTDALAAFSNTVFSIKAMAEISSGLVSNIKNSSFSPLRMAKTLWDGAVLTDSVQSK